MKCDCPIKQGIKVLAFFILVSMLASCTNTPEQKEKGSLLVGSNNYHSWRYDRRGCASRKIINCQIDFSSGLALADFESWVIAFRTGGRKVNNYNQGFTLGNIGGSRALLVTQSDTRDPGGKRRTEAKVALIPVGDYKVSFDIFIESVPVNFDSTISQIKCGSGKPPINIKITNGGGVRVKSGGNHVLRDTAGYLTAGWHKVEYKIENSKKRLSLSIDGKSLPINNASSVTDCRDIHRAGRDYFIKIGLYEKEVAPGYRIAYKNFALKQL